MQHWHRMRGDSLHQRQERDDKILIDRHSYPRSINHDHAILLKLLMLDLVAVLATGMSGWNEFTACNGGVTCGSGDDNVTL
ncbi:unnamed protein product [Litomosoides sigmodontis]|uniref:Uncharacterized protein n=1 Tax=Litomosoides sigmodontis TaxID=42156 RepID=A0A3P6TFK7_LITSI|nr:unnamed protein product [Litomosoides sigmodontis]